MKHIILLRMKIGNFQINHHMLWSFGNWNMGMYSLTNATEQHNFNIIF